MQTAVIELHQILTRRVVDFQLRLEIYGDKFALKTLDSERSVILNNLSEVSTFLDGCEFEASK